MNSYIDHTIEPVFSDPALQNLRRLIQLRFALEQNNDKIEYFVEKLRVCSDNNNVEEFNNVAHEIGQTGLYDFFVYLAESDAERVQNLGDWHLLYPNTWEKFQTVLNKTPLPISN